MFQIFIYKDLEISENHLIIDTKEDTDAELENKIKEDMQHQFSEVDENGEIDDESYRINVRGAAIEQQKAMIASSQSVYVYCFYSYFRSRNNSGSSIIKRLLLNTNIVILTLRRIGVNDKSLFRDNQKAIIDIVLCSCRFC